MHTAIFLKLNYFTEDNSNKEKKHLDKQRDNAQLQISDYLRWAFSSLSEVIMQINIDKEIDAGRCPTLLFCTVATTCYDKLEKEHMCYKCWLAYCKEHNIEIIYT